MRQSSRFIVALTSALLAAASASAQQVGTATAVNPLSESTPPGGTAAPLVVGAHIVHKEKVHTTPAGTVQLLFTDKSTMSIAPNTDIVIDEYVYDPNTTPNILEWRVGLGLEVPIWKLLNLGFLAQYRADVSNVPAFSMHDFSVTAGPAMRF
jgi:hypothetical protein